MRNYKNAPLKKRFLSLILDYFVIIGYGVVLFGTTMFIYFVILDGVPKFNEFKMNLLGLTMVMPVLVFSIVMESSKSHATFGKRKMRITVVSKDFEPAGLIQIILRNIIKFIPWQFAHMMIFRGFTYNWELSAFWMSMIIIADIMPFIWIATIVLRKDHRGIHDLIANTVVVEYNFL